MDSLEQISGGGAGTDEAVNLCQHRAELKIDFRITRPELPVQPPGRRRKTPVEKTGLRQDEGTGAIRRDPGPGLPPGAQPLIGTHLRVQEPNERFEARIMDRRNRDDVVPAAVVVWLRLDLHSVAGCNRTQTRSPRLSWQTSRSPP